MTACTQVYMRSQYRTIVFTDMIDLSALNREQRQAVECLEGPLLVLAGAGSGKTRVLTYRIANLIEHGVRPWNILALTFTNKAAREMRERTESLVGAFARDMWVMTFHSLCARLLRMEIEKLGDGYDRNFVIYDDGDQISIIESILKNFGMEPKEKRLYKDAISDVKNKGIAPEDYFGAQFMNAAGKLRVYREYESRLRKANALDFDDLIGKTAELFERLPEVLEKYRDKFKYVLVDEYQDTNYPQYRLIQLLCAEHRNICVVGDDDQSIYGWRGADIRNILEFEQDFSGAKVIRLEQNYRSTGTVLEAANAVIKNNMGRKEKKLWTEKGMGSKITVNCLNDERREAEYVCRTINEGIANGKRYSDFAVLYRMNVQSRILETVLLSYGIPHKVYGGQRFYERKEIKDILAYLRLVANPADDVALQRIINVPPRGIGSTTVKTLAASAAGKQKPMLVIAKSGEGLEKKVTDKLRPFTELMGTLCEKYESGSVYELASQVVFLTGYREYLANEGKQEAKDRYDNILELLGNIKEIEESISEETDGLQAFLESVALMSDIDAMQDDGNGVVSLMTLHSAKGLEFDNVFITGMEDGIFPTSRATFEQSGMEEERRLFYVGITRAREKLYLLNTNQRTLFGHTGMSKGSRFLFELPEHIIENESAYKKRSASAESSYTKSYGMSSYNPATVQKIFERSSQAAAKPAAPRTPLEAGTFEAGQRIRHEKFGDGTVVSVMGSGNATLITIDFKSVGVKKLAAAYAPLEKL